MTQLSSLKKNLVAYGLFQVLILVGWVSLAWLNPIGFWTSYLPILPLWLVVATVRNYKRIERNQEVSLLPYTCFLWVTLVLTLIVVLQGFFDGILWAVFRLAWTWKLRRQLQDYRHRLDLGKTDTI